MNDPLDITKQHFPPKYSLFPGSLVFAFENLPRRKIEVDVKRSAKKTRKKRRMPDSSENVQSAEEETKVVSEKINSKNGESEQPLSSEWCIDSEMRFFKKLISHKPAGVSKHFHMMCLVDYMSNVYEDEDTDFEDVLTAADLDELCNQKNDTGKPRIFKPKYGIRPTPKQIWEKLDEMYDMSQIEENEYTPDGFLVEMEFSLPEDEFGDLLRKKVELNKKQNFVAPQNTCSRSNARKKRRDSGETQSSRSSTPASRDHRKTT